MFIKAAAASALFASAVAAPVEKRATCPPIHVFGARETTAPAGYGSAGTVVKLILNAHPGATAEAINYPAAGGTDAAYASSVQAGAQAVASQINTFNTECPSTLLVYVGYSQVSVRCNARKLTSWAEFESRRVLKSQMTPCVAAATQMMASPIPIRLSALPQAMLSKRSSGWVILATHPESRSTTALLPQAA